MEKSLNEDTYEKLKYDIMNFKLVPGRFNKCTEDSCKV